MTTTPGFRPFTTATGYVIQYRTLPPDFLPALRARVRAEHEATKPAPPTVRVETAPGTFTEQPVDPLADLPTDEDLKAKVLAHREALRAWERVVIDQITDELKRVLVRTVRFEVDAAAVQEVRELYALAGKPLDDLDDRTVMLLYVILPDMVDQQALAASLEGVSVEEAALSARATFRRAVAGAATA